MSLKFLKYIYIMKTIKVKWYQSLNTQGILGVLLVTSWLIVGLILVMKTRGQKLVLNESSKLIEEIGNSAVADINIRTSEIAALTRSLAITAEELPKNNEIFKEVLPSIINFQNDFKVAGGGVWPEPYLFDSNVKKNSFFWGRNLAGNLEYYDDYNKSRNGYHNEEWYVVVRYSKPRQCFWSQSYMDPHSYQPMVTCSVATFDNNNQFSGVATIDLKLEGLQDWITSWQDKTGGYAFIVDRNNKFITFPEPDLVKNIDEDYQGNRIEEFIIASELSAKQSLFSPIAQSLDNINQILIKKAQSSLNYNQEITKKIDRDSYQINSQQATLINAIITNTNKVDQDNSYLVEKIEIEKDFILNESANVFTFLIPDSYWKFVIIQPKSNAIAVADNIVRLLIFYLTITIIIVIFAAYFVLRKLLIQPLIETSQVMESLGNLVIEKRYDDLKDCQIQYNSKNEIGKLATVFNSLTHQLANVTKALKHLQKTQAQLIQSEKMSSLGEMIAGIAHEINNPVNFIYGNIAHIDEYSNDLLKIIKTYQKTYTETTPEIEETIEDSDLEFIQEDLPKLLSSVTIGTTRIREIVLSLRNFSRLDESEMKAVNIHEGIDTTLLLLQYKLKQKTVFIDIIKNYGKLPLIQCYAGQLNQVFMNLISNGIDAFEDNLDSNKINKIEITTTQIEDTESNSQFAQIIIKDNGKGIENEILDKIFDPFFTTKEIGKGTGMGLAISYQIIVEKHKGNITCESQDNEGTQFTITIPIKN